MIDRDQEAKIYFLFEHKSARDRRTPIQLLRYILEIWDRYAKVAESTGDKLPIIIPVLITHAQYGWRAKRIIDLIDLPSDEFKAYIPDFDYILFDAIKEDPEEYNFNEAVRALLTIWRYSGSPDFIQTLHRVFRFVQQIDPEAKFKDFVIAIMEYLSAVRSEDEYIDIQKVAETEFSGGEEFMGTIAEMFRREGREEIKLEYEEKLAQLKNEWAGQAKVENAQETLLDVAADLYGPLPRLLQSKIKSIQSIENLRTLTRKIHKTESLEEFSELVTRAADN
mgnify:CR=1 FL=1